MALADLNAWRTSVAMSYIARESVMSETRGWAKQVGTPCQRRWVVSPTSQPEWWDSERAKRQPCRCIWESNVSEHCWQVSDGKHGDEVHTYLAVSNLSCEEFNIQYWVSTLSDGKHGDGLSGAKHCHLLFPTYQSCHQISSFRGELNYV